MLCVGEKLDKSSSVLMGFFFSPPYSSFSTIIFYFDTFLFKPSELRWGMKRRLNCLTAAHLAAQGGAVGKVAWALLGVFLAAGSIPKNQAANPLGWDPVGGQEHLLTSSLRKSHNAAAVLHQHRTPGAGYLGIPPPAAPAGCPSPDFGAECVFCSLFRVVSTLFPSRNLSINQPHLSGIVDSTLNGNPVENHRDGCVASLAPAISMRQCKNHWLQLSHCPEPLPLSTNSTLGGSCCACLAQGPEKAPGTHRALGLRMLDGTWV